MSFPTLTKLYEEVNYKKAKLVVGVAGHLLSPNPRDISYDFSIGDVPTCSFEVDNPAPVWMIKDAAVQVWVGFNGVMAMVFNGDIESVSPSEDGLRVQCSGQSKKLDAPYKATIISTNGVKSANTLVGEIMAAANVFSYIANLPAWTPGTVVQQPLQFSSFGEAVNKLAEPFGSPFYEMPSGFIRVDTRDPIPAPTAFRTYFSGVLTNGAYAQPAAVAAVNPLAQPRIHNISKEMLTRDIRNKIIVRGAEVSSVGGSGETITTLLEHTALGPSPWIPPVNGVDQYVEMIFSNELLDTVPTMTACALRLFDVWNRLYEDVSVTVDGDPEIFLGATVEIIDLGYTGINAKYVVMGYHCNVSESGFTTTLDLRGGRSAGVTPALSPFAFFTWTNQNVPIPPNQDANGGNGANTAPNASKVRQFIPKDRVNPGPDNPGQDPLDPGDDGQRVIVTFDASASVDPDGRIVSYAWLDDAITPHSGTGVRFTVLFNPNDDDSVQMTLTVTDNQGLTAQVTQTVNVNTFSPSDGYGGTDGDGTTEDSSAGGGDINVPVIFVALATQGIAATLPGDGGSTFNTYPDFGYNIRCVVAEKFKETDDLIAVFAGRAVYITTSYLEVVPSHVSFGGEYGVANDIVGTGGNYTVVTDQGYVLRSSDYGETWEEQAHLSGEVFYRISGSYILGGRGLWVLDEDDNLLPFDPNQESIAPWVVEPAYLLVDEDNNAILFNLRLIQNPASVAFNGSGLTQGTGISTTPSFIKVIQGTDKYIALASTGHIHHGDLSNSWQDMSPGGTALTSPRDFIGEGGMEETFLAAEQNGVFKTVDNGIKWLELALRASGVLTIVDPILAGEAMTIGSKTFTFIGPTAITSSSVANPTTVTTGAAHGLSTGNQVTIAGHSGSTPDINGTHIITVTGASTFTIPVNVTVGGTGGTVTKVPSNGQILVDGDIAAAINGTDGFNTAHPQVTAEGSGTITIRAIIPGTAANSIVTTETFVSVNNKFDSGTLGAKIVRAGLQIKTAPVAGETFTVEGKVFTFTATPTINGHVGTGTLAQSQTNIVAAINGTDGINTAHTLVVAQAFVANTCVVSSKVVRDTGTVLATAETFAAVDNIWLAGTTGVNDLGSSLRLQAINVPQTAPVADLYAVTTTGD